MSVKPRYLALAAAAMAAGTVLVGSAGSAHAGTVKTINSSATVCVTDFGLPDKCFGFAWTDQLAPGQFNEHILTSLQVGRYVGSFTVRVGVSAAQLGYGSVNLGSPTPGGTALSYFSSAA
ncbi:hypothetical protein AB0J35_04990 [Nonomuraea angiospora]|uniref:hypothetical protein n=1 Tax=Nonomuraea angiospora TaxID=46172 RepID=UPI0034193D57